MAHYITPDGRVVTFDAEVKSDGTIRPKNYSDFVSSTISGEKDNRPEEELKNKRIKQPKSARKQRKQLLEKVKPAMAMPINHVPNRSSAIASDAASIRARDLLREQITNLINSSEVSVSAKTLVRSWYLSVEEVHFGEKRKNLLSEMGHYLEIEKVNVLVQRINHFIRTGALSDNCRQPQQNFIAPTPRKNQSIQLDAIKYKEALSQISSFLHEQLDRDLIPYKVYEYVKKRYENRQSTIVDLDSIRKTLNGGKLASKYPLVAQLINQCNQIIIEINDNSTAVGNEHISKQSRANKTLIDSNYETKLKALKEADSENQRKRCSVTENANIVKHGRLPKYGYSRDYFGRIQERDSYREDRMINPYHSRSNYDREDDNESLDSLD